MAAASTDAGGSAWRTFQELTKIRISSMSTLSTAAGYVAVRRGADGPLLTTLVGTLLVAMGAAALNEVQEWRRDALMPRTCHRPIPRGVVSPLVATEIALGLAACGLLLLLWGSGPLPALIALAAAAWYNGLYTPLKRVTAFAVVPGAVIGALPPAIGWTAGGGDPSAPALVVLCGVMFLWQVPHFWLLAQLHREGYERAGFPTMSRSFSDRQVMRLVFTWTCVTIGTCTLLPLFHATRGVSGAAILGLAGAWCVTRVSSVLGHGTDPGRLRRAFMDINVLALGVLVAVTVDGLWNR